MVTTRNRAETESRRRVCCLHDKRNGFYGPSQLAPDNVRQNTYTCIFAQSVEEVEPSVNYTSKLHQIRGTDFNGRATDSEHRECLANSAGTILLPFCYHNTPI